MTVDFSAQPSPVGKGTLGRRLVIQVAVVVAIASVVLSAATFLATRQILLTQTDTQLDAAMTRGFRTPPADDGDSPRGIAVPGQPIGTIIFELQRGVVVRAAILRDTGADATVSRDSLKQIIDLVSDGKKHTVHLAGIGDYRVASVTRGDTFTTIVALPLETVNRALAQLMLLAALLAALAILGATLITRALVAKNLRPLHEVAVTAAQVATLELDRGEVDLAIRVPESPDQGNEVGRVAAALNNMLNRVEQALAARQASETKVRQFVADASHELRNPLASIRGYAELTRRNRQGLPQDTQFALGRIESESERMSRLVEDMLLLARLDAGPVLQLKDVDLTEVVVNAVSDAQVAGPEHQWALELPETPVLVRGDSFHLHQVVANLLANARKHTPAGTRVVTGLHVDGENAVIEVADNGPGIPPDLIDKVFERFSRADVARARQEGASSGLGLSIVAAVVAAHGGTASVTSKPGDTRFFVAIPLAHADTIVADQ